MECYQCFGYCGGCSWWASVTRSRSQGLSPDVHCCGTVERLQLPGFPESLLPPFIDFSNTQSKPGELQLWCFGKSWVLCWLELWGSFPNKWLQVFSPQKTASLPLLPRPIILAVYERISLSPSTRTTRPGTFYYPYFGPRSACSSIWGQSQLTATLRDWCFLRLQESCIVSQHREKWRATINYSLPLLIPL